MLSCWVGCWIDPWPRAHLKRWGHPSSSSTPYVCSSSYTRPPGAIFLYTAVLYIVMQRPLDGIFRDKKKQSNLQLKKWQKMAKDFYFSFVLKKKKKMMVESAQVHDIEMDHYENPVDIIFFFKCKSFT